MAAVSGCRFRGHGRGGAGGARSEPGLTLTARSRSPTSLWRKRSMRLRERVHPVWTAWLTPSSRKMTSERLEKAGMADATVAVPSE